MNKVTFKITYIEKYTHTHTTKNQVSILTKHGIFLHNHLSNVLISPTPMYDCNQLLKHNSFHWEHSGTEQLICWEPKDVVLIHN